MGRSHLAVVAAAGAPGHISTPDHSCTRPAIPASGQDFRNFEYSTPGSDDALPGTGLDRTREGYVEMLEMGTLSGATAAAVTHNSAGVPANCGVVQAPGFTSVPAGQLNAPTGGLMGTGTLINVQSGLNGDYKADALDGWSTLSDYTDSGFVTPRLDNANPPTSLVIRSGDIDPVTGASSLITAYRSTFAADPALVTATAGARAVASVFMHTSVMNEYVLDNATASLTDWIITQPLKNRFVSSVVSAVPYTALLTSSGACETIAFGFFDREEQAAVASNSDFSPLPPGAVANSLCWESTVLAIRNDDAHTNVNTAASSVVGSVNLTNVSVKAGFQNGWAAMIFTGAGATTLGMPAATVAARFAGHGCRRRRGRGGCSSGHVLRSAGDGLRVPHVQQRYADLRLGFLPGQLWRPVRAQLSHDDHAVTDFGGSNPPDFELAQAAPFRDRLLFFSTQKNGFLCEIAQNFRYSMKMLAYPHGFV